MRRLMLLGIVCVMAVAGCVQEQPTGKFLTSQNFDPACGPQWECTDWSDCIRVDSVSGVEERVCTDVNNCANELDRPYEKRICGLPKISTLEPEQMLISITELQARNWVVEDDLDDSVNATQSDIDSGFLQGHYVHYYSEGGDGLGPLHFYNRVRVYEIVGSSINISFSFDAYKEKYNVGSLYEPGKRVLSLSELDNPLIGEDSIAFNVTTLDKTGLRENYYTICFIKWDVVEIVTMGGSQASYEALKEIAEVAEAKMG